MKPLFSRAVRTVAWNAVRGCGCRCFSIDSSVRIALTDRDVPGYFKSLEHLVRYCAESRGEPAGNDQPRSHDTSRIAWAKLLARIGEQLPLECPACGGDIRLIAFITDPAPIRKILEAIGEPLEPPPLAPARGPPMPWPELVQAHDDRDVVQTTPDEFPVIDIHAL